MLLDKETRLNSGQQTLNEAYSALGNAIQLLRNIKTHNHSLATENNQVDGMLLVLVAVIAPINMPKQASTYLVLTVYQE